MSGLGNRRGIEPRGDKYPIDVVFVVDATESMGGLLDSVKYNILRLNDDIQERLTKSNRVLDSLQVRLIVYRDLIEDVDTAFELTNFFRLPEQREQFDRAVRDIEAFGGGDAPESGLEALFLAMRSPWRNEPKDLKRRHIIMLFTDQDVHALGAQIPNKFAQPPHPKSLVDIKRLWASRSLGGLMNGKAKRMVLFAPESTKSHRGEENTQWTDISQQWEGVWLSPVDNEGLREMDWQEVVDKLVATI